MEDGGNLPRGDGAAVEEGRRHLAGALLPCLCVISFATLTALGARVTIHVGPVPLTLQVFFVLLAGMALGPKLGMASQLAYVAAGLSGIPVFASPPFAGPGYLLGPTGGYLVGFVAAAWLTGLMVESRLGSGVGRLRVTGFTLAGITGLAVIYAAGASWLMVWMARGGKGMTEAASAALKTGVVPFIAVDVLKSAAAALVAAGIWSVRARRDDAGAFNV